MSMYRVRTQLTGPVTGPSVSTHFFDIAGGTPQQAATAVATFWTAMGPAMDATLLWAIEPEVDMIDPEDGHLEATNAVTPANGGGTGGVGDVLPRHTQGLLRMRTGLIRNKRELRGRLFLPGTSETFNASGKPSAAYRTACDAAGAGLIASANAQWVVYGRKIPANDKHPDILGVMEPVGTAVTWTEWASLRSRRD